MTGFVEVKKESVTMSSRIEQIIDEIEEYIDNCKFQPLSTTKIIVNKDQIDELLRELRMKTPEEIKRYQKIIDNKDAILADAQTKADTMIQEAKTKTDELVSDHEIMQQAYAQANEIVAAATEQAQTFLLVSYRCLYICVSFQRPVLEIQSSDGRVFHTGEGEPVYFDGCVCYRQDLRHLPE